jgi:hypothetical protein
MPAASASLIDPAVGQLVSAAQSLGREPARLLAVLAAIPDPRARRGVRHRLAVILGLAVCAVLAGARSFTAIAEWAADADQATTDALGVTGVVPSEPTFRRTLQALDADALDDAAGSWAQQRTAPAPGTRRAVAVDGKTLRGSGTAEGPGRHLLAALDHGHGVVLGQVDVEAKTNEIPLFTTLLDRVDLAGAWSRPTRCTPSSPPCPGGKSPSPARQQRLFLRRVGQQAQRRQSHQKPVRGSPARSPSTAPSALRCGSGSRSRPPSIGAHSCCSAA